MTAMEQRRQDCERLRAAFYAAFDRSRLEQILFLNISELDRKHERLGEGSHFTAWRLRDHRPASSAPSVVPCLRTGSPLSLVMKRPHAGFTSLEMPRGQAWLTRLQRLRASRLSLIPPMEWVGDPAGGALVMPFGAAPLAEAAAHWQPLACQWEGLHAELARQGLRLAGTEQGRSWCGIPFIVDLSDLEGIP